MSLLTKLQAAAHEQREVLSAKVAFVRAKIRSGFKRKVILLYPERPRRWHLLYGIVHELGLSISTNPHAPFDVAMAFWDITERPHDAVLEELGAQHALINAHCGDISKKHVEKVFRDVFGYGMAIDPRTYTGTYVKKSDTNATHDGKVMQGPSEPQEGYIYQKLINNQYDDETVRDMRVFVCKNTIPFVFYRYKKLGDRFDHTIRAEMNETDALLSKEEQQTIFRFCRTFGLEWGEIDILRDRGDGKIYIVDVSNTPTMPPKREMTAEKYRRYLGTLSELFAKSFLQQRDMPAAR